MNWIALLFALEIGVLPNGYLETYTPTQFPEGIELQGSFYVDMQAELLMWDLFFIGGGSKVYVNKYNLSKYFSPNLTSFSFVAGIRAAGFEMGFRHYCLHPIVPWIYGRPITHNWEGWYEEIYLRIEGGNR